MNSMVTKNVEARAIVAGNPAKFHSISRLNAIHLVQKMVFKLTQMYASVETEL